MENPEEKIMNEVETPERNRDWMESVSVPVPLNELMKYKDRIHELEKEIDKKDQENKEESNKYWREWSRANEAEKKYDALKKDYQKLLGVNKDDAK